MPNFIEIGGGSRKFSKKLVDLTRNDPIAKLAMTMITGVSLLFGNVALGNFNL